MDTCEIVRRLARHSQEAAVLKRNLEDLAKSSGPGATQEICEAQAAKMRGIHEALITEADFLRRGL